MKPKPTTEKPAVAVTTKVRLTFKGQTFDLSMEELVELYGTIGRVVLPHMKAKTEFTPNEKMLEEMKRIKEENEKAHPRQRPHYPPQWPSMPSPITWRDGAPYLDPSSKPMCQFIADTPPEKRTSGGTFDGN